MLLPEHDDDPRTPQVTRAPSYGGRDLLTEFCTSCVHRRAVLRLRVRRSVTFYCDPCAGAILTQFSRLVKKPKT